MLLCSLIAVSASATRNPDVILRANHGFIAQPVGQLTICGDYWFHTLIVKIPNKPQAQDYERAAAGGPLPKSRFSPLAFFTNKQEIITMNIDLQCSANVSSFRPCSHDYRLLSIRVFNPLPISVESKELKISGPNL
jgi:hypothetical protein